MTLADNLQRKLSSWKPSGDGRHTWAEAFPADGWEAHVSADHNDVVGSLLWEFTLTRTADAPAGLTGKAWGEAIAARASGLRERLRLLEADAERGGVR